MSRIWNFSVASGMSNSDGVWYSFESTTLIREYLVPIDGTSTATKRQVDENEEILALVNQVVQDFIENLQIGEAEVVETEVKETALENLEPIEDTPSNQMIFAFEELSNLLESTMLANKTPKSTKMKKKYKNVQKRFSWFFEHSNSPCENRTNAPFATQKWLIPQIKSTDVCASLVSLMKSTVAYNDHKVCLDDINLKGQKRAKRRNSKIKAGFKRSKKVFNQLLKALFCTQRLTNN